ncbi:MAG: DUF4136 domain-containing protein [Cyclobacteriaceae bacterium]|jgi:hypothetical protein|nr:DUF4136 domain-containing protein [Cyclobacteriaceae bacterium]MDH4296419.1 DUF4136 domain-containing protein [Cyclobacteriaceae bacterium]MDH5248840.1 DUF4136 domain-containing protein [Cyclobacteriaceae bacterium]
MRSLASLLLILLFSCSPAISVYNDYDHALNVSEYSTYHWKVSTEIEANQNPMYYNQLNDKRIKTAVDNAMTKKGYMLVADDPVLTLHYHIIVEDKSVFMVDPSQHLYSPYWMRDEMNAYQYQQGTLIIDLMDTRTNDLVWRGWAVAVLEDMRPESIEKRLNKTIERIFEPLPHATSESTE